jgi:hypothetical protein
MREQVSVFCAFDTSFDDINCLKQEMISFVRDPANSRDFYPDIEIEVVSIAEMNKLELRVEILHKSNWSNETLRTARRSKFMCALVLALRKVPIAGPGGSDAALGSADKPTWSVAVPPEDAVAAYKQYKENADAKRLHPLNKPDDDNDKGKSTGTDFLGVGVEGDAVNSLTSRKPGVDPIRDDTWNTGRDDTSTIGRPSMDGRPDLDEVRGLLHKASNAGKRKGGATLSPNTAVFGSDISRQMSTRQTGNMPPLPSPAVLSPYAPPPTSPPTYPLPPPRNMAPGSPTSISTGHYEDVQFQTMVPPPRSGSRPRAPTVSEEQGAGERRWDPNMSPANTSTNPYRSPSTQRPFKRE